MFESVIYMQNFSQTTKGPSYQFEHVTLNTAHSSKTLHLHTPLHMEVLEGCLPKYRRNELYDDMRTSHRHTVSPHPFPGLLAQAPASSMCRYNGPGADTRSNTYKYALPLAWLTVVSPVCLPHRRKIENSTPLSILLTALYCNTPDESKRSSSRQRRNPGSGLQRHWFHSLSKLCRDHFQQERKDWYFGEQRTEWWFGR